MWTQNAVLIVMLITTAGAAATDLRTGLIPNRLVASGLLAGLAARLGAAALEGGQQGVLQSAFWACVGLLVCSLVPALLFKLNGMGGGDLKLLAACGACLGPSSGLELQLNAFTFACLFALGRLAYHGQLTKALRASSALALNAVLPRRARRTVAPEAYASVRFAPAVFAGAGLVSLLSWRTQ